jgi:predicted signal transduction protein with EAL and GGDEF domain
LHVFGCACIGLALFPFTGLAVAAAVATLASALVLSGSLTVVMLTGSARRQGDVDPDTGLPNGFGLAERMRQAGAGSSFLVADVILAGVGDVREALGYAVGTELMRRVVEDIGQVLPPAAVIGRVAGDELVVVQERRFELPEGAESSMADRDVPAPAIAEAEALALTLSRSIDHGRYLVGGIEVAVKAHIGLAIGPWHGGELAEMVRRASLSAVKGAAIGADRVIWHVGHHTLTSEDLVLLADLRLASERNELWVAYQPQISSRSRLPVSVEALLRWESPTHGRVAPGYFIPLAERSGLIDDLTEWVLTEVLNAQVRWRAAEIEVPVSANLSAKSLSQADLPEKILSRLEERRLPATSLALEVTETAATPDMLSAINLLRPLHDRGVRISIDDFGTGYTSLSVLASLPLDELKVDQGFVMRSPSSAADSAIVQSVRELAHRLGLAVVAEGVESADLDRRMTELGFDILQGYYYAKPLAEPDLVAFVKAAPRKAEPSAAGSVT